MISKQEIVDYFFSHDLKILLKTKKLGHIIIACNYQELKKVEKLTEYIIPVCIKIDYEFYHNVDNNSQNLIHQITGYFISNELLKNRRDN